MSGGWEVNTDDHSVLSSGARSRQDVSNVLRNAGITFGRSAQAEIARNVLYGVLGMAAIVGFFAYKRRKKT